MISAVTGMGLTELKDVLWAAVTDDRNRIAVSTITHRPLDGHHRVREEDEFIFENAPAPEEDDEEYYDYDEEDWDDADGEPENLDWEYGVNDEDDDPDGRS